jgi:hypothetical protein
MASPNDCKCSWDQRVNVAHYKVKHLGTPRSQEITSNVKVLQGFLEKLAREPTPAIILLLDLRIQLYEEEEKVSTLWSTEELLRNSTEGIMAFA